MKQIISKISLCLFILLSIGTASAEAQQNMPLPKKHEIKSSQIQLKQKGNIFVKQIDSKSLKAGYNYMVLESGNTLFTEIRKGKIKSLSLVSKGGTVLGSIAVTGTSTQFQCNRQLCYCSGDADCNDMFTTNVCGPNAICIDNACICAR